jgi:hypothetical protein
MIKIDLYNNHEVFVAESKQNRAIDKFCSRHKISRAKLETHPNIGDLVLLLAFDQHQTWFTKKDQQIWAHAWQWVYSTERPLTPYLKSKLNSIVDGIEYRRQQYEKRVEKRKHIQQRIEQRSKKLAAV